MTITYNWTIAQMDAYPEFEGHTDVVFTVHWRLDGTDGTYTAGVYGSIGVQMAADSTFIQYNDLTKEQVVGWVQHAMGEEQVETVQNTIATQIAALINPSVITPPLPW